jgi:hypothetical protein
MVSDCASNRIEPLANPSIRLRLLRMCRLFKELYQMNARLSIKAAILWAVKAVVSDPWYFVKLSLAWIGFSILFLTIPALILAFISMKYFSPVVLALGYFLLYVFGIFVWVLPIKLLLRYYDKGPEPFSLGLFISQLNFGMIIKLLLAAALFNIIVAAGLILLIIPGIYFAVKFIFTFITIIDTNSGIIEAFKKSYAMTNNNFWPVLGLLIIEGLLLNLIITIPVAVLMMIHAYRQLNPAR